MKKPIVIALVFGMLSVLAMNFYDVFDMLLLDSRQRALLNQPPLPKGAKIDKLIVYKSKRELHAFYQGELIKIYPISLGANPVGHKEFEGDMKTPEGRYVINDKNPNSAYHKNLGISYPNESDMAYAKARNRSAGGAIKIHGMKNGLGGVVGGSSFVKRLDAGLYCGYQSRD